MIKVILIIVWLLLGLIAAWRRYHGILKNWYNFNKESYWDSNKRYRSLAIVSISCMFLLFTIYGPISLISELIDDDACWWFTTKDKK